MRDQECNHTVRKITDAVILSGNVGSILTGPFDCMANAYDTIEHQKIDAVHWACSAVVCHNKGFSPPLLSFDHIVTTNIISVQHAEDHVLWYHSSISFS